MNPQVIEEAPPLPERTVAPDSAQKYAAALAEFKAKAALNPPSPEEAEAAKLEAEALGIYSGEDEPKGFRFKLAGNMEVRPPQWSIRDFMEAGAFVEIHGKAGDCKTFLTLDLAASVATGHPFHGREVLKPGLVIYVAGEGHSGLARRLKAWSIANNVSLDDAPLVISHQAASLCDAGAVKALAEAIAYRVRTFGPPRLIIFDTWSRNLGGDENGSLDSAEGVSAVDRLRKPYGAAAIVVHHTGHDRTRARGSTVLPGAADLELQLVRGADGIVRVEATKIKDDGPPEALAFKLRDIDLGIVDDKGWPIKKAVLDEIEYKGEKAPTKNPAGKNQAQALEALESLYYAYEANLRANSRPVSEARVAFNDWRAACIKQGLPPNRFGEVKEALARKGLIKIDYGFVLIPKPSESSPKLSESFRD